MQPKSIEITLLIAITAVGLALSADARAVPVIYDLNSDWSETSNPNGPWTYEVNGGAASSGIRCCDTFGTPQQIWGSGFSGWSKSNGSEGFTHDWSTGAIYGHTPSSGGLGILWSSPNDGIADITGGTWEGRDIGRGNFWSLSKNGVELTSGNIASGDAFDSSNPFDFSTGSGGLGAVTGITVSAGDILAFNVSKTSNFGDYLVVDFTVALDSASVPEPAPLALMVLGLLGLALQRRRVALHK